ncbi:hypothetical protein [Fulvimarina manganoxydans]|uniref:hypothetical protein n=1 Tax=Fulvimarina manganoxydans TaxID=937218 RepID=UPI00111C2495|nr:hypothetical protein [Fulvimarina manganoxydans]
MFQMDSRATAESQAAELRLNSYRPMTSKGLVILSDAEKAERGAHDLRSGTSTLAVPAAAVTGKAQKQKNPHPEGLPVPSSSRFSRPMTSEFTTDAPLQLAAVSFGSKSEGDLLIRTGQAVPQYMTLRSNAGGDLIVEPRASTLRHSGHRAENPETSNTVSD